MRSQLAEAVRDIFSRHMKQEFPQFSLIEPADALLGGLLYQWPRGRDLTCYTYLQICGKDHQRLLHGRAVLFERGVSDKSGGLWPE